MEQLLEEGPTASALRTSAGRVNSLVLEMSASLAAMAGLLAAVLSGFAMHTRQNAASDFKTLYASAWCFARGIDAYSFPNLANVFEASHIVVPQSWYAHAPVYPPFTLALLAPLTLLPMDIAIYLWIVLSALTMALAIAALARVAGEAFLLGQPWRILLIALAALSPLLSAGLELGNVSVMASALCILALTARADRSPWPPAVGLAAALLLKPHIALWVLIPLLFLKRSPGRATALRAYGLCVGVAAAFGLWLVTQQTALAQMQSYGAMLAAEVGNGSMAATNHTVMEATAQITSLESLIGFWRPQPDGSPWAAYAILALFAAALAWSSWKLRSTGQQSQLELVAAWCAFGLIATYHRAHDGTVLLLLLPVILARLRSSRRDVPAWCLALLLAGICLGPAQRTLEAIARAPHLGLAAQIVVYRQAPLAAFLLALLLLRIVARAASLSGTLPEHN